VCGATADKTCFLVHSTITYFKDDPDLKKKKIKLCDFKYHLKGKFTHLSVLIEAAYSTFNVFPLSWRNTFAARWTIGAEYEPQGRPDESQCSGDVETAGPS